MYLFEYVDSWGVKDPLCMTRATRVGEVKESKKKKIEFHVLTYLKGDYIFVCYYNDCIKSRNVIMKMKKCKSNIKK